MILPKVALRFGDGLAADRPTSSKAPTWQNGDAMGQRRQQHRGKREPRRSKRRKKTPPSVAEHGRLGAIPLIERTRLLPDGREYTYWDYDSAYRPELPAGAVRGNIERQVYCCMTPRYFYVDLERPCIQCGGDFVFRAREQKYWYETLRFNLHSTAIRCVECRKRRRSDRALAGALDEAVQAVKADGDDLAALVQLAEATVAYAERFGDGDLDRAIAAVRNARKRRPELLEALFWEGRCQALAGREAKARECWHAFLDVADPRGRLRRMVKQARRLAAGS